MSVLRPGCIADDFTGATGLSSKLVRSGMRVMQAIADAISDADLQVVASGSSSPANRSQVQDFIAAIAVGLAAQGARQFVVAGGEASGALVQAPGVESPRIGARVDPGVSWRAAHSPVAKGGAHLAPKPGNFGMPDFLSWAFAMPEQASGSPAGRQAHG
jgi:uncharacterized protein YgbK (DUF1537 family)